VKGFQVPHFPGDLGGKFHDNAGEYGVPIGAVPSSGYRSRVVDHGIMCASA
jgi:hypothetical protein